MALIGEPWPRNSTGIFAVLLRDPDNLFNASSFMVAPVKGNIAKLLRKFFLFILFRIRVFS